MLVIVLAVVAWVFVGTAQDFVNETENNTETQIDTYQNYTDSYEKAMDSAVNVSINIANLKYLFEYQQVTNDTITLINNAWYNLSDLNVNNEKYVKQYRIKYGKVNEGCMFFNDKFYEFKEELEHYELIYNHLEDM